MESVHAAMSHAYSPGAALRNCYVKKSGPPNTLSRLKKKGRGGGGGGGGGADAGKKGHNRTIRLRKVGR